MSRTSTVSRKKSSSKKTAHAPAPVSMSKSRPCSATAKRAMPTRSRKAA